MLNSVQHLTPILNKISLGLTCYKFHEVLKDHACLFEHVFCQSTIFCWDYASFVECLKPQFSEDGSNRKREEITTYKAFLDFLEICFHEGKIFSSL